MQTPHPPPMKMWRKQDHILRAKELELWTIHGEKFSLPKFKMKMVSASMDLWDIVDRSEKTPLSNVDPKVLKEYQRCVKNAISVICLNMADNQLVYIKSCKGPAEASKTF